MIPNDRKGSFPFPEALKNAKDEWFRIAREMDKEAISSKIYRGEYKDPNKKIKYEIRELLLKIYHNKCAYCEMKDFAPDVEHYRPKKGITGLTSHPGYYWLCYEWSNLIPACTFCNSRSGKWNKFPVRKETHRVNQPLLLPDGKLDENSCKAHNTPLVDEKPFLFHPEVDDPRPAFKFDIKGKITGIDQEQRGKKTIQICDLNRDNLKYRRQKMLDDIVKRLNGYLLSYFNGRRNIDVLRDDFKRTFQALEIQIRPEAELSLMATYIFKNFNRMILPLLETKDQKEVVMMAFSDYESGKL